MSAHAGRRWRGRTTLVVGCAALAMAGLQCETLPLRCDPPDQPCWDFPSDAGSDAKVDADATAPPWDAGGPPPDAAPCTPVKPLAIPDGWVSWTDWSCKCELWLPGDEPVPPIAWEPCEVVTPPGIVCQQMVTDWAFVSSYAIGVSKFSLSADGKPLLLFARVADGESDPYMQQVLAEADGPVLFTAMRAGLWNTKCAVTPYDFNEGRFAFDVDGDGQTYDSTLSKVDGLILGSVGEALPIATPFKNDNDLNWGWFVGKDRIVKLTGPGLTADLYTSDFLWLGQIWNPGEDPEFLPINGSTIRIIGTDVLFQVGNYTLTGIMAYDQSLGLHPLVRWYGDTSKGAGNIGTDGTHLVWTNGENRPPGEPIYPTRSIMAAPYTTNPDALQPTRLRSELSGAMGTNDFAVGCGYAGHEAALPGNLLIVRIADGVSWVLPQAPDWYWGRVLGFTCEEVFVTVGYPKTNILRIRLDSLGPGIPPD